MKNSKSTKRYHCPYLFTFFLAKFFSLLYGNYVLRSFKLVFIHPSSKIYCSSKIKSGKNFSVGRNCYIDALSKDGFICGDNVSMGFHTHIDLTGSLKYLAKGIKIGNNVGLGSHGHYGSGVGGLGDWKRYNYWELCEFSS